MEMPAQNGPNLSLRLNTLRVILPACRKILSNRDLQRDFNPTEAAKALQDFVLRQFSLGDQLARATGFERAEWEHLQAAGNMLLENYSETTDLPPLEAIIATVLPSIDGDIGGQGREPSSVVRAVVLSVQKLNSFFKALPMGLPPEESTEYLIAAIADMTRECVNRADLGSLEDAEALQADLIPTLTDVVIDAWSEVATSMLLPSGSGGAVSEIEADLVADFGSTLSAMPMGHEGSEEAIIKMAASHIYELSARLVAPLRDSVEPVYLDQIRAAYCSTFIVPLFRSAWLLVADAQHEALKDKSPREQREWLDAVGSKPVSLREVYSELSQLCSSRRLPIESLVIDRAAVEESARRRLEVIWVGYQGLMSLTER